MIRRIYVDNFKCLVNFELRLQPLSLLVGTNGVGKSAVLDVLFALRQLLSGEAKILDPGIFPASSRTRWQAVPVQVVEVDATVNDVDYRYRLEIEHSSETRRARVVLETLEIEGRPLFAFKDGEVRLYRDNHSAGPVFPADWSESALARVAARPDNRRLTAFLEFMRKIVVCGLYPRAGTAESTTEEPLLVRDGGNFSAWYRHITQERQDLLPGYWQAIQEVVPGLRSLRLERVGLEARALLAVFDEGRGRYELRLDELSDGQRALLTLYALLHLTAEQGTALFLDEPENYVALAEIQPWLVALADACGASIPQAVLCSHHPELIDYLGGERSLMLAREVSGVTTVRRLSEVDLGDAVKLSEMIARGWSR